MSRIFISHSSLDNFEAVAFCDWLAEEGWNDVFLDLDPERGVAAGERWERALHEASTRCEAVVFLVSEHWLASGWCLKEYGLARGLNKKLFAVVVDPKLAIDALPPELKGTWQVVNLTGGQDMRLRRTAMPGSHEERHVGFSEDGLRRLKRGLEKAGLDPRYFAWPPANDSERSPYRGLKPLEAEDAGIFFGRDAPIIEAIDALRGLRTGAAPRILVILGASGAGKSSFLRAGLLPRLARDSQFLPLPVIRPEKAAIDGESGLVNALEIGLAAYGFKTPRAELRAAAQAGAQALRPYLAHLIDKAFAQTLPDERGGKPPTLALAVDQAEELFQADGFAEGETFLSLVRDLVVEDRPALAVLFTIRSDSYDNLQTAKPLKGLRQQTLPLSPMPQGAYQTIIEEPAKRLNETARKLVVEPPLTQRLLQDVERGANADGLPLLAFTLEQLYLDYGRGGGRLKLEDYEAFGGLEGAIGAAVKRAMRRADSDPRVPRDAAERRRLLRQGLVPWLAGVDPDTKSFRRNIARASDIPQESRPLIGLLVEERLLTTDSTTETDLASRRARRVTTIEPAHEALLRQWELLRGWLEEDRALLATLEGVKRAAREWDAHARAKAWLSHQEQRLAEAEALDRRPDIAARLEAVDQAYLVACRRAERAETRRARTVQTVIYVLLVGVILGLVGWIKQRALAEQWDWWTITRPYAAAEVWPYVLSAAAERRLKPLGPPFRECAKDCPQMVVLPAGSFEMGSPPSEPGHVPSESPQHPVTIPKRFALAQYDVTFDDWDACVKYGDCPQASDGNYGRGLQPAINVSWNDAQVYVAWLSEITGKTYRLLTEAEWEYAARGGTSTPYYWGSEVGTGHAACNGCGPALSKPTPVGSFPPNPFHLYDMAGDVWQLTQDCWHDSYANAPTDGAAWLSGDCNRRVLRGGSWDYTPNGVRSATRVEQTVDYRDYFLGFRVARDLD